MSIEHAIYKSHPPYLWERRWGREGWGVGEEKRLGEGRVGSRWRKSPGRGEGPEVCRIFFRAVMLPVIR